MNTAFTVLVLIFSGLALLLSVAGVYVWNKANPRQFLG
jgi:hypothetical protein